MSNLTVSLAVVVSGLGSELSAALRGWVDKGHDVASALVEVVGSLVGAQWALTLLIIFDRKRGAAIALLLLLLLLVSLSEGDLIVIVLPEMIRTGLD